MESKSTTDTTEKPILSESSALLGWLRGKLADAEQTLRVREEMAKPISAEEWEVSELAQASLLSETAHHLKTWPSYFDAVADGRKTFEARKADRDYRVGDTLVLKEWDPETNQYSGREVRRKITYILTGPGFGVEAGCCILALASDNDRN